VGHRNPSPKIPLAEIDDPPAHDAVYRRDWAALDDRGQGGAMLVVQSRRLSGSLAVDEAIRAMSVELENPVARDLQRHAADLRRFGARRTFVDRRERQQPTRLRTILRTSRRASNPCGVKIGPKLDRHREPPSFATLNQPKTDLGSPSGVTVSEFWYKLDKPDLIVIDQRGVGLGIFQDLRNHGYKHLVSPGNGATTNEGKTDRFGRALNYIYDGLVKFPESAPFLNQVLYALASFPDSKELDLVDSITQVVAFLPLAIKDARKGLRPE
jgi:hypothetical protein